MQSRYLFEDRFGRPSKGNGKGNDTGDVEGVIGCDRSNYMMPMPRFESFEALARAFWWSGANTVVTFEGRSHGKG